MVVQRQRKLWYIISASMVVLTASSCSAQKGKEADSPNTIRPEPIYRICDGLLGESGSKALAELADHPRAEPASSGEAKKLKKAAASMRSALPEGGSRKGGDLKSICTFSAPPTRDEAERVDVKFGWVSLPEKQKKMHLNFSAGSAFIELGIGINERVKTAGMSSIYYTCRLHDREPRTVKGTFRALWTNNSGLESAEEDARRARILLSVASKMSEELSCGNNPDLSASSQLNPMPSNDRPAQATPQDWPSLPGSDPSVE